MIELIQASAKISPAIAVFAIAFLLLSARGIQTVARKLKKSSLRFTFSFEKLENMDQEEMNKIDAERASK